MIGKKRIFTILIISSLLFFIISCGDSEYANIKSVLQEIIDLNHKMLDDIREAEVGDAVADAINNYADGMEKIIPEFERIIEENPELLTDVPEELKPFFEKFVASQIRLSSDDSDFIKKIKEFRGHPAIIKAAQRFTNVGQQMQMIGKQ